MTPNRNTPAKLSSFFSNLGYRAPSPKMETLYTSQKYKLLLYCTESLKRGDIEKCCLQVADELLKIPGGP